MSRKRKETWEDEEKRHSDRSYTIRSDSPDMRRESTPSPRRERSSRHYLPSDSPPNKRRRISEEQQFQSHEDDQNSKRDEIDLSELPRSDHIALEKAQSVYDFAVSMIKDCVEDDVKSSPFYPAYEVARSKLETIKEEIRDKYRLRRNTNNDLPRTYHDADDASVKRLVNTVIDADVAALPRNHHAEDDDYTSVRKLLKTMTDVDVSALGRSGSSYNAREPHHTFSTSSPTPYRPSTPSFPSLYPSARPSSHYDSYQLSASVSACQSDRPSSHDDSYRLSASSSARHSDHPSHDDSYQLSASSSARHAHRLSPHLPPHHDDYRPSDFSSTRHSERLSPRDDDSRSRASRSTKADLVDHRFHLHPSSSALKEMDADVIDYVEASCLAGRPLSEDSVAHYFSKYGPLSWCIQGGDRRSVIFAFQDSFLYTVVLNCNYNIGDQRVTLTPVKNGRLPATLSRRR